MVRIGIVGTGFTIGIARQHFEGFKTCKDANVVAVYDIIQGRAQLFLERHGIENVKVCQSLEELFEMVDAVSICTPNNTHAELAIRALEAGKHVLVEKPFANTYEEGLKAYECSLKYPDLVAMTVFNYRERASIQFMKRIIDAGALGTIVSMRYAGGGGRMWDSEKVYLEWRMKEETSGTGSLADFGAHQLDLTDYLLHDLVGDFVSFTAASSTLVKDRYIIDPDDPLGNPLPSMERTAVTNDDVSAFTAISESGALFNYQTGRLVPGGSTFEIVGSNGMLSETSAIPRPGQKQTLLVSIKDAARYVYQIPELQPLVDAKPVMFGRPAPIPIEIPEDLVDMSNSFGFHGGVLNEFVNCIVNGEKPVRSFGRGLYVQKLIDNFAKAAKTGKTVYEKVSQV
ncbi:MAG: Gfo/Idh/MocA family protein [Eubacteriales bacterium]